MRLLSGASLVWMLSWSAHEEGQAESIGATEGLRARKKMVSSVQQVKGLVLPPDVAHSP